MTLFAWNFETVQVVSGVSDGVLSYSRACDCGFVGRMKGSWSGSGDELNTAQVPHENGTCVYDLELHRYTHARYA